MAKRAGSRSNRSHTADAAPASRPSVSIHSNPRAQFNPYGEELIDRIVAEWGEVVPEQDAAAREIAAVLSRIAVLFQMDSERVLTGYRLSNTEFHLLGGLRRVGAPYRLSPSELSPRYVPVTSGGLTGVISRLERRGLVRRREDPFDGRGVLVELTDAGRRLIEEVMKALARREALMIVGLKPAERRQAAQLLRSILRAANAGLGATPPG